MYGWFLKHLMGKDEAVKEPPFKPVVPPKDLSVFDKDHPRPKDELVAARLREAMAKASDEQMKALEPKDAKSLAEFKRVVGTALRCMVNSEMPKEVVTYIPGKETISEWPGGIQGYKGVLSQVPPGPDAMERARKGKDVEAVPVFLAIAKKHDGRAVIWLHPKGKASLFDKGKWNPSAKALLDSGVSLYAIDVLRTGEQVGEKPFPVDKNYAGYTYGYNRTLLANRVRDVLAAIAVARDQPWAKKASLLGWGEMGPVAVLAKALAGDAVARTAADLNQFRFENVKDAADPMMLPGAVKYGGMAAFLALCAPGEVLAHNHKGTSSGRLSQLAYEAASAKDKLTRSPDKLDDMKVVEWLLK
jgi:hypothetical protein